MVWWLKYRNILDYLEYSKDSESKKQDVVNKNGMRINEEIKKISNEKVIHYLFDINISDTLKQLIAKDSNAFEHSRIEKIVDTASKKEYSLTNLELLYKKYSNSFIVEDVFRNIIYKDISKIIKKEENNVFRVLDNNDIPISYKKLLILAYKNDYITMGKILPNVSDTRLIDYIVYENKYSASVLSSILFEIRITDYVKEKLIKEQITSENILGVLTNSLVASSTIRSVILSFKKEELNTAINNMSIDSIKKIFSLPHCTDIFPKIYNIRYNDIQNMILNMKSKELLSFMSSCKYDVLLKDIYTKREQDILNSTNDISGSLLIILSSKNIKDDIKQKIINENIHKLIKEIENIKLFHSLILPYLCDEHLPNEVKKLIYEIKYDKLKDEVLEFGIYDIGRYYFDKHIYSEFKKLILDLSINSKNIFIILNQNYENTIDCIEIINNKNTIIKSIIKYMNPLEIVKMTVQPDIMEEYKNIIIENNIDLVRKKLNEERQKCFLLAIDLMEVPHKIKEILLEGHNIDKSEVDTVFLIGKYCRNDNIIDKYNEIKNYIESLNIDFKLFMQYGIGSREYKNWYKDLEKVLQNKEMFKKVFNYLLNNYYNEENDINTIKNFQEVLHNYNKYEEFFLYLVNNNYKLSNEEKDNLSFILNSDFEIELKEPSDLNNAKNELYNKYIDILDNKDLSLYDLKCIFNKVLFCNADNDLDRIGGKIGLLELRNNNIESKSITNYIDTLIKYVNLIEIINNCTDINILKDTLRYLLENSIEDFINIKNTYNNMNKMIRRLYELDSRVNLTNVEDSIKVSGVLKEDNTLDYSDKNYCLYAHVLSNTEQVDEIINGKSTGKKNFISLSPISYLGQKYYYSFEDKPTFAYDKIPENSFIYSSKSNLSSNMLIKRNSSEVKETTSYQEGILETSKAHKNNAEALLYREGLKPVGLILCGNRRPTEEEIKIHKEYNLPFIITQLQGQKIDDVKYVFNKNNQYDYNIQENKLIEKLYNRINNKMHYKDTNIYTGREIALFTDTHSMIEPLEEILKSIKDRGIEEIYSLGDNVGLGPNPAEVFDLIEYNKVKSISGNSEYYNTLGIEPFSSYFDNKKTENQVWTSDKLGDERIEKMKLWTPSLDIKIGNQNVGLCHFINDIRWDFKKGNNTWSYQENFKKGLVPEQFLYTGSNESIEELKLLSKTLKDNEVKGVIDAINNPLLGGKKVNDYDSIIQGHVHFNMKDKLNNTDIYTLRASGIGYELDKRDTACYYILKEKKDGTFDIERVLIRYNKNKLLQNVSSSSIPHKGPVLKMLK